MKKLFAALLAVPLIASAATGAFVQTGSFASLPGYGYEVIGSFNSPAPYTLSVKVADKFLVGADYTYGPGPEAGIRATLTPTQSNVGSSPASLDLELEIAIVNLATGERGLPTAFYTPGALGEGASFIRAAGYAGGAGHAAELPVALRFSNPRFDAVRSLSGMGTYVCFPWDDTCTAPADSHKVNFSLQFQSGNYLSPSNDPNCADFSCMTYGRDALSLQPVSVELMVSGVPEPSTWALFTAALFVFAWKRGRT